MLLLRMRAGAQVCVAVFRRVYLLTIDRPTSATLPPSLLKSNPNAQCCRTHGSDCLDLSMWHLASKTRRRGVGDEW